MKDYRAYNFYGYTQQSDIAVNGPFSGPFSAGQHHDFNSLITGNVSMPEWERAIAATCTASPASGTDGLYSDGVKLNASANASGLGQRLHIFSLPPGCTSVTLSVPLSEASSKSCRIVIYDSSLTSGTRAPWCNFIDGTAVGMPTTSDLTDGTHLTVEGHAKAARMIQTAMGI